MDNDTPKPDHKILVLEGNPACGSKILSIAQDGTRQKSGANQQQYYTPSQFSCSDIETFAAGIRNLEAQPNKFIIHGQPRKPIIPGQRINRRKHENDAKAPPSILPHATVPFFGVDIDNLSLADLGYGDKSVITECGIEPLVARITEHFLADFIGVSYYAQFSASCGWKDDAQKLVKIHIWWWLDQSADLSDLKNYAKKINASAGLNLLDTAIYQAVQPIYIAAPIFPNGQPDHLIERSKLVILEKKSASLSDVELQYATDFCPKGEDKPVRVRKPKAPKAHKPLTSSITPTTFQGWIDFFELLPVAESLHETIGIFFSWAIRENVSEQHFEPIKQAIRRSPRIQAEPERFSRLISGEWDDWYVWCKEHNNLAEPPAPRSLQFSDTEEIKAPKARNVKHDIDAFQQLSTVPQNDPAAYFKPKQFADLIALDQIGLDIRYGSDKHGHFAAILLKNAENGEPAGVQRFYDRNIKGRSTNQDFTWGMSTKAASFVIGTFNDKTKLVLFSTDLASGSVLHYLLGFTVIVTLNHNNIKHVSTAFNKNYPAIDGFVVCDNHAHQYDQMDNVGVLRGVSAAKVAGYQYIIPNFADYDQSSKPISIFDLWQLGGDDAIKSLLDAAKVPPRGKKWQQFNLSHIGLRNTDETCTIGLQSGCKVALKPLHQAILGLVNSICYRAPFQLLEDAKFEIAKAIRAQKKRLGSFQRYDDSELLQYADFAVERAYYERTHLLLQTRYERLIKSDQDVTEKWTNIALEHKTIVINSGLGTGKTEWIKRNCLCGQFESVLIMPPRRSLAKNMALRFSDQSLEIVVLDYEDVKTASPKERREMDTRMMTVVPNSLSKVGLTGSEFHDVVVLDEIELLIHHIYSKAIPENERQDIIKRFRSLIKNGDIAICAQAGITELTRDFMKSCGREIFVVHNSFKRFEGLLVDFFMHKDDCMARLKSLCDADVPVLVPCSSLKFSQGLFKELSERYPEKRILLLNRENAASAAQSRFLTHPNVEAKFWDIVIFTPVLEQGVSIDEPRFKEVVAFCNVGEGTGTPDAFVQMPFRTRKIERLSLWCDPKQEDKPTGFETYLAEAVNRFNVAFESLEDKGNGKHRLSFEISDDVILAAKAKAANAAAKNNTIGELYAILTGEMGCAVNIVYDAADDLKKVGKEILQGAKEKQKVEFRERTQNALKISVPTYEELMEKRILSESEQWQLKRHKLERELCVDLDSLRCDDEREAVFVQWNQGRGAKFVYGLGEGVLSEVHALPVTEFLLENKPQVSEYQGFRTRYLIRRGLLESLHIGFDHVSGDFSFDQDFKFRYADFRSTWWFRFACENRDAVNGSSLGARIKGDVPSDNEIGLWIRAMGVCLKSQMVDLVTGFDFHIIKKIESKPCHKKRKQHRIYNVNPEAMQPLIDTLKRRHKAGNMPWVQLAERHLSSQQQSLISEPAGVEVAKSSGSAQKNSLADRLLCELRNLRVEEPERKDWGVDWLAIVLETSRLGILNAARALGAWVVLIETLELLCLGLS
jgi:hypothetical protein